jgi:xylono-1,5-lactonase
MERVASGYALAEAPVAAPDGGVYFSDFLAGGVYHFSPRTGEVETIVPKRRGVGGMALHADGGLVMTGRDVVHVCAGQTRTLYANPEKTILNDLTIDSGGRVIVGCLRFNPLAGETPVSGAFMRLDETVVMPGVLWANGCALSPDGDTFYGCDYHRGLVLAVEHTSADEYGPARTVVVSPSGVADGLAIDGPGLPKARVHRPPPRARSLRRSRGARPGRSASRAAARAVGARSPRTRLLGARVSSMQTAFGCANGCVGRPAGANRGTLGGHAEPRLPPSPRYGNRRCWHHQ